MWDEVFFQKELIMAVHNCHKKSKKLQQNKQLTKLKTHNNRKQKPKHKLNLTTQKTYNKSKNSQQQHKLTNA